MRYSRGIYKVAEEASKCREALDQFKKSDGYRRLQNHDSHIRLLTYRQLLAQLKGDKEGENELLNGISGPEKSDIKEMKKKLWEKKVQPFHILSVHYHATIRKMDGHKLRESILKTKMSELEREIRTLEGQTGRTGAPQTQN